MQDYLRRIVIEPIVAAATAIINERNNPMDNTHEITIPLDNGARLVMPAHHLAAAVLANALRETSDFRLPPSAFGQAPALPPIGTDWNGGRYAGLSVADNNPVALVRLPGEEDDITWTKARDWALKQGGFLPSRIDLLVLLQNMKSAFKPEYYWSGEEHASDSACAWGQGFINGSQAYWPKDGEVRAVAVRRYPI